MIVRFVKKLLKVLSRLFFNKKQHMEVDPHIPGERYTAW